MVVLFADSGVYLCNFFKLSPDLHNLNKSSIFQGIGLYFSTRCHGWINGSDSLYR